MARPTRWMINLHLLGLLTLNVACGTSDSTTCAPLAEHDAEHAASEATDPEGSEEGEGDECEPGTNCMCSDGAAGTQICDVETGEFVQCDCAKAAPTASAGTAAGAGAVGNAGASGVTTTVTMPAAGSAGAATAGNGATGVGVSAAGMGAAGTGAGTAGAAGGG